MLKVAKVKNKMPAPVQITAEQLLREAKERELELAQPPPKQKISDPDELKAYQLRKRKEFEDNIRKNRTLMINWIKYSAWEESQKEIQRARSVYERALDVDHRNIVVWLKYAEMEMRLRQVNHARNVWDRAITILPRSTQLWYKYTYMEEMLENIAGARQVFKRWMELEPEEQAWHTYINFELRCKELDRVRAIYEKFVIIHPKVKNWIKYAKFEEKHYYISSARKIYERGVEFFGEKNIDEKLLISFAEFEEAQREHSRARRIYRYGLDHLDKGKCEDIYKAYTIHEKKYGDCTAIEDVIVSKCKLKYEKDVAANPHNYDAWFDYLRLMEDDERVATDTVREAYERAIANVPPAAQKRHWRRYIYLWINYALYEELRGEDADRCRQIYQACLELISQQKFTFAKIWLMFAHFEVRQKELTRARKILGTAIGKCPKDKLLKGYIDLELQLREFDRCRILYEKFLQFNSENCTTWMNYAELETSLGEADRARAIFELAINQPKLDMPEVLWKGYMDFEIKQEEFDNTRKLYRRLLKKTQHAKIWVSFATFELACSQEDSVVRARKIYKEAHQALKPKKEERLMLLKRWSEFESHHGDDDRQQEVAKLMPSKVKNRRKIQTDDGLDAGWEEYYDYIFPDDESSKPNLKLLAMAKNWKATAASDEESEEEEEEKELATEAIALSLSGLGTTAYNVAVDADSAGEESEDLSS